MRRCVSRALTVVEPMCAILGPSPRRPPGCRSGARPVRGGPVQAHVWVGPSHDANACRASLLPSAPVTQRLAARHHILWTRGAWQGAQCGAGCAPVHAAGEEWERRGARRPWRRQGAGARRAGAAQGGLKRARREGLVAAHLARAAAGGGFKGQKRPGGGAGYTRDVRVLRRGPVPRRAVYTPLTYAWALPPRAHDIPAPGPRNTLLHWVW